MYVVINVSVDSLPYIDMVVIQRIEFCVTYTEEGEFSVVASSTRFYDFG